MILRGKQEENVDIRNLIGMSEKCTLLLVLKMLIQYQIFHRKIIHKSFRNVFFSNS